MKLASYMLDKAEARMKELGLEASRKADNFKDSLLTSTLFYVEDLRPTKALPRPALKMQVQLMFVKQLESAEFTEDYINVYLDRFNSMSDQSGMGINPVGVNIRETFKGLMYDKWYGAYWLRSYRGAIEEILANPIYDTYQDIVDYALAPERSDIHDIIGYDESVIGEQTDYIDLSKLTEIDLSNLADKAREKGFEVFPASQELTIHTRTQHGQFSLQLDLVFELSGAKLLSGYNTKFSKGQFTVNPRGGFPEKRYSLNRVPKRFPTSLLGPKHKEVWGIYEEMYKSILSLILPPERSDIHDIIGYDESLLEGLDLDGDYDS
jgi:hypothetical protein